MKRFNCASTAAKCGSHATVSVLCVTLAALMLATISVAQDRPATKLTGQQVNVLVSQEATQNVVTYLTSQLGPPLSGTWSGTVTASGWNLTFSGSINGQAAALTEAGTFKGKIASWKDSGTVGSDNVSGSGTATLIPSKSQMKWRQSVGAGAMPFDDLDDLQTWVCENFPDSCDDVHLLSDYIRSLGGGIVAADFARSTGSVFTSTVQTQVPNLTTIQEGSIAAKTGAISYDSDTFTAQGQY